MMIKNQTLDDSHHGLLFDIRRSVRYHMRRQNFFDTLDKLGNMLSVVFGSAAVYGVLEQEYKALALTSAALVTVISAVNLVIGSSERARKHADLMRQYVGIEKLLTSQAPTEAMLQKAMQERLDIESTEPPVLHVLNVICHNDVMRACGYPPDQWAKVGYFQGLLSQVMDIGVGKLKSTG